MGADMAVFAKILVILGPTASGKSALAMQLARSTGAEILSADSMQVYREMNIGTAKPTEQEQSSVRHHLIDVVNPDEEFTVARFVEMADQVIADAGRRGVPLIVSGGTPLYFKSLFVGLFQGPPANSQLRERLRLLGNQQLHERLRQVDAAAAARIHANDTKRMIRALEIFELTGNPISSMQTEWEAARSRHEATWIGLLWDKERLNRRINARTKTMMGAGWVQETQRLLERFGRLSPTASEATGYRELIDHLEGKASLDQAIEQIKIGTRQLARKQMKWFKRFANVHWLLGDQAADSLVEQALRCWRQTQ